MLQSEQRLRFLIKKLITENIELDDVIEDFEDEFDAASKQNDPRKAIIAIRKNNALLEIIFRLVDQESSEFNNFYQKSGFKIEKTEREDFLGEQEKKRETDLKKIKGYINKFLGQLKKVGNEDGFRTALNTLKSDLRNYAPMWYPLQYLFMSIERNDDRFNEYLENLAEDDSNWQKLDNKSGLQLLKNEKVININGIVTQINNGKLTSEEKKQLIHDKVTSRSFSKSIKKNDWSFVTDLINDVAKFFFPDLKNYLTSEIESWFEELQRAFGKDPNEPWLEEMLLEDPDFKKLVNDAKNGNQIKKETLQKVTKNVEEKANKLGKKSNEEQEEEELE